MHKLISLLLPAILATQFAFAEVKLPSVIGSHMVLQRDEAVPIWGWAEAGEAVTVEFQGKKVSAKAGKDGRWAQS